MSHKSNVLSTQQIINTEDENTKPSGIRTKRHCCFLALCLRLALIRLVLSGCGGDSASDTSVSIYVAGKYCFGIAIVADGNIRVTNFGDGTVETDDTNNNARVRARFTKNFTKTAKWRWSDNTPLPAAGILYCFLPGSTMG